MCRKGVIAYGERLHDQQNKKAEQQQRMDVNRGGYGLVEMRNLGKIGDPETDDENGKKKSQDVADIAIGAFHSGVIAGWIIYGP